MQRRADERAAEEQAWCAGMAALLRNYPPLRRLLLAGAVARLRAAAGCGAAAAGTAAGAAAVFPSAAASMPLSSSRTTAPLVAAGGAAPQGAGNGGESAEALRPLLAWVARLLGGGPPADAAPAAPKSPGKPLKKSKSKKSLDDSAATAAAGVAAAGGARPAADAEGTAVEGAGLEAPPDAAQVRILNAICKPVFAFNGGCSAIQCVNLLPAADSCPGWQWSKQAVRPIHSSFRANHYLVVLFSQLQVQALLADVLGATSRLAAANSGPLAPSQEALNQCARLLSAAAGGGASAAGTPAAGAELNSNSSGRGVEAFAIAGGVAAAGGDDALAAARQQHALTLQLLASRKRRREGGAAAGTGSAASGAGASSAALAPQPSPRRWQLAEDWRPCAVGNLPSVHDPNGECTVWRRFAAFVSDPAYGAAAAAAQQQHPAEAMAPGPWQQQQWGSGTDPDTMQGGVPQQDVAASGYAGWAAAAALGAVDGLETGQEDDENEAGRGQDGAAPSAGSAAASFWGAVGGAPLRLDTMF